MRAKTGIEGSGLAKSLKSIEAWAAAAAILFSFPLGATHLTSVRRPVEILRDRWGVPHIYAASAEDLFFLAQLFREPQIALHRFKNGGAGVGARQEFAHLHRLVGLGHDEQQLGMALQIVVARRVRIRRGPGKFQRLVLPAEFH